MPEAERVVDIYERMLELPEEARDAFLERECDGNENIRKLVRELEAHEQAQAAGFEFKPEAPNYSGAEHRRRRELLGTRIGPYQLKSILGHGGAGTVYLAERVDQRYRAHVAIKVLDVGQHDFATRFRAEWQILGNLSHPNIARIQDAGELESGQLYLILEYVHGDPIDLYCDVKRLSISDRLRLFLTVCSVVHSAHMSLVIHRDLKSANILVTHDGVPKLLDFGIAALLGAAGEYRTGEHRIEQLWTMEFASPEQIQGRPLTMASDVYSLGIILYGLLTGLPPIQTPDSLAEENRAVYIVETEPWLPSEAVRKALSTSAEQAEIIEVLAQARRSSPKALARRLSGDLDAIVRKAIAKDPQKRYPSAEALAADIRRHLAHEPVQAREGGWLYSSRRFVRRHVISMSVGAVLSTSLIGSATLLLLQNREITAERARAETVSQFMLSVFSASDPFVSNGKQITASELLQRAGQRIRLDVSLPPLAKAQLLYGIGRAYRRRDMPIDAIDYLSEALQLRTEALPSNLDARAAVEVELALAYRAAGQFAKSETAFNRALELKAQVPDANTEDHVRLLNELGRLYLLKGNDVQAESLFLQSLERARTVFGRYSVEVAMILLDLANVAIWREDREGAIVYAREADLLARRSLPPLHPDRVMAQYVLANALYYDRQLDAADDLYESVLSAQRKLYGPAAPKVAETLDALATIRRAQGRLDEAFQYAKDALSSSEITLGKDHYMTGYYHVGFAIVFFEQGDYDPAKRLIEDALEIYAKTLPANHEFIAAAYHWQGEVLLGAGEYREAQEALENAIGRWDGSDASAWRIARSQSALGEALVRQGKLTEGEQLMVQSYKVLVQDKDADPLAVHRARDRLRDHLVKRGDRAKLKSVLGIETRPPPRGSTGR